MTSAGKSETLTTVQGCPVGHKTSVQTVGPKGPLVAMDTKYMEEMAHFNRERIPERVVHAKGAGAHGYFEVTDPEIQDFCKAAVFNKVGKRTPIFVRFSTVGGEIGSADTVRDPRGFAIKFYTEEGIWDLVGNNTPVFFIRDPILFFSLIHTQKRNPETHLKDVDMFWDFFSLRPESVHQFTLLFSDRGIPDGYRHMNGYGSHTFKLVNSENLAVYCKFHLKTDQGIKNLDVTRAQELSATDPDYSIRDLHDAIKKGEHPSWTFYIQMMTFEQAEFCSFNPFDVTKVWSHKDFPLLKVGRIVLDKNPSNYFAEVEQVAFAPANMVPGIEPSPDKMLHGRILSYPDAHRYRLGPNFHQIPINRPKCPIFSITYRDGPMCVDENGGNSPNYYPNSFSKITEDPKFTEHRQPVVSSEVYRYETGEEDNYTQVRYFYQKVLNEVERQRLAENIGNHLKPAQSFIQQRVLNVLAAVDGEYAARVRSVLMSEEA